MLKIALPFAFVFFFACLFVAAQNSDEEKIREKERRRIAVVEQILGDAQNLRLPENRAYVYAKVADQIWQTDEKRARTLFQSSIGELIAAQTAVENDRKGRQLYQNLLYGQSPRWDILWLIANHDADFALDAQARTRPKVLPASLESFPETQAYSMVTQFVKTEIQNEQRLISIAADQNPQRAAKLLRESLKKTISYEVLNLLRKIYQKDAALGAQLADETAEAFLARNFAENPESLSVLPNFLNEFGKEKTEPNEGPRISEKLVRELAAKMLDFWLDPATTSSYVNWDLPVLKKNFPERLAQVKQKFSELNRQNRPKEYEAYDDLMRREPSGEELLNQAGKFPKNLRQQILQQAAYKLADSGDVAQAGEIIKRVYPDQADGYISNWQANRAGKAASEGKFDEANNLIGEIADEKARANAYSYLASVIYQKDPEKNKAQALAVLEQARNALPDQPETTEEINVLLNLAAQYAAVEPSRAFPIIESLIPQMDELAQAQAVVGKYQPNNGAFRQGEFQVNSGGCVYGVCSLTNILSTLNKTDPERVFQITGGFVRLDVRLSLQIQLLENKFLITELPIRSRTSFFINK